MAGLAALLKRKLGKDTGSAPKKKVKLPPGTTPAQLAALASKNTRTARRKLRQLGLEGVTLEDLPPVDRIDALSDVEDDEDGGDGDLEEAPAGRAYDALLSSLADTSEALAGAVELRRRELAGDSDQSESEDEEEEEEEEEGDGRGSDEEEEQESASEGEEAAADGQEDVEEEEEDLEEEEEEAEEEEEKAAINGSSAAPASAPLEDHFDAHLEAQLSEDALAALAAGPMGYIDLEEAASGGSGSAKQRRALAALQAWLPGARVQAAPGTALPASVPSLLRDYGVRERLVTRWKEVHAAEGAAGSNGADGDFVSPQQRALFALLSTYTDVHHPCKPYPTAADGPDPELDAVLLHCLNHVARSADRIKKNKERLGGGSAAVEDADAVPRDQGFTRPKVLILLPMRCTALRVVRRLLALALRETRTDSIQNKSRFLEEFGDGEEGEEGAEEGLSARAKAALARKPSEHRALFAGNLDDHFRLGIKLTRGAARLYSDFFQSDVLVASPLALATKLSEAAKEGAGAADFLSSIEIVVLERGDVLGMQNWAHVSTVMAALNAMPAAQRDVDIMRVREWYLAGQARHYRQTILLSSFASAEGNALAGRGCANHAGRLRITPVPRGVLGSIVPQIRQTFQRLTVPAAAGPAGEPDARFERFKTVEWPRIRESARGGGQLIYIPSYFDFVRVRNFLRAESASFVGLCEYTDRGDMARARSYFADGRRRVLLYTERAQFYNRHRIRGINDVLFYQLPEHPQFYSELLNFMDEEGGGGGGGGAAAAGLPTATVVYTKYDALRLERVVGAERAKTMLKKKNGTFLFC